MILTYKYKMCNISPHTSPDPPVPSACVSRTPGAGKFTLIVLGDIVSSVVQWVVRFRQRESQHAGPPDMITLHLLSLACLLAAEPARWDHHPSRRLPTTTPRTTPVPSVSRSGGGRSRTWDHRLGWSVPAERCQIPADSRQLPSGTPLHSYYIDYVHHLLVQDKTLVSPVVFEGAMVSRTNTYKNLYFVSFKVFRVLKGHIHQQLQGHVRLLFQTESRRMNYKNKNMKNCPPVPFNVRSGRRYLVFVKNLRSPGRYIAVAKPEVLRRKSMREVKEMLSCDYCGKFTV